MPVSVAVEQLIQSMMTNWPDTYRTVMMMHALRFLDIESLHGFMQIKAPPKRLFRLGRRTHAIPTERIPSILRKMMLHINSFEDDSLAGIFRVSGSEVKVKDVIALIASNHNVARICASFDLKDCASAFKRITRSLSPPLLPGELVRNIARISPTLPPEDKRLAYCLLIRLLPKNMQTNLLSLFSFLYAISRRSPNMNSHNLAVVFTPSLVPESFGLEDVRSSMPIVEFMIQNGDHLTDLSNEVVEYLIDAFKSEYRGEMDEVGFRPMCHYSTQVIESLDRTLETDPPDNSIQSAGNHNSAPALQPLKDASNTQPFESRVSNILKMFRRKD